MVGIFDKIKKKKADYDRRQEDRKIIDIQNQLDKRCKNFKKSLDKEMKNMGLSLSYIDLWGSNVQQRIPGTLVIRFNDKEGYPITLVQSHAIYEGTPWGAFVEKRIVYCGASIWGTIVPASIPFTLIFRSFKKGFMKGRDRIFLPLVEPPIDEKKWSADPRVKEPLVATLNSDKKLGEAIDNNTWAGTVLELTHKSSMSVGWKDAGGRCLLIPFLGQTCIFLRTFGYNGDNTIFNFKKYLEIISTIRRHVLANPHNEEVSGQVPAPIFVAMYTLCKTESLKPSAELMF